jgi:TolB protein
MMLIRKLSPARRSPRPLPSLPPPPLFFSPRLPPSTRRTGFTSPPATTTPASASLPPTSKATTSDADTTTYKHTFDTVLFSDLSNAGIFDMVSKSLAPQSTPGTPAEMNLSQWSQAPASAAMVAFGNIGVQGGNSSPTASRRRQEHPVPSGLRQAIHRRRSDDTARQLAHQFADDIIFRLSGGTPGIAESKLFYSKRIGPGEKRSG